MRTGGPRSGAGAPEKHERKGHIGRPRITGRDESRPYKTTALQPA